MAVHSCSAVPENPGRWNNHLDANGQFVVPVAGLLGDGLTQGRQIAEKVPIEFPTCPLPKACRLGQTLNQGRAAFLAYFETGRATTAAPKTSTA